MAIVETLQHATVSFRQGFGGSNRQGNEHNGRRPRNRRFRNDRQNGQFAFLRALQEAPLWERGPGHRTEDPAEDACRSYHVAHASRNVLQYFRGDMQPAVLQRKGRRFLPETRHQQQCACTRFVQQTSGRFRPVPVAGTAAAYRSCFGCHGRPRISDRSGAGRFI